MSNNNVVEIQLSSWKIIKLLIPHFMEVLLIAWNNKIGIAIDLALRTAMV